MNRRKFIQRGAWAFTGLIFVPRLIRAQTPLTADGLATFAGASSSGGGGGGGDTPFITLTSAGTPRSNFSGVVGCVLSLTSSVTITALGRYVISGSSQTHNVGIWSSSDTTTPLAQVTVNASGLGTGWAYVSLGTPITPGTGTFYLGSAETSGTDSWYDDDSVISVTAIGTISSSGFHSGAFQAPSSTGNTGSKCYVPVNFKYH
jgi:hypothetical protein